MRRYKKSQIIEIIKALGYVNELILDNKEKINSSELVSILTDCQQKALEVGNFIESEVKENLSTVHLLEDYCELLYQISINHTQRRQLCKKTRIVINNIAKSIRKDIPDSNKVIVFLPYMVSMWDSLESVWMAAKEDKDCECYVIPIPYYDKNPDGSLGEMHYEGNDYPDYVNIVQWQEYNMTEQHPDIIYIHNPYDDYNHVTTIHPNYYAKKLKKCTDMLVYIPYFVSSFDNVPAHFCVLP
ncbi:MAG: hypothetical protein PHC56_09835, partial [Herbinix sp.]|nr:hypothetical protein [Herbinix sp.]